MSSSSATSSRSSATSIVVGVRDYIELMVSKVTGMKVLVVDDQTIGIISMVYSMSEILKNDIFRVERLDVQAKEDMRHMNAICFLRPTIQNFIHLSEMLKTPRYNEYHIFFSNAVSHHRLERLACCDEHEVVHQVQEYFADVYAINKDLFSLNEEQTIRLSQDQRTWGEFDGMVLERTVQGLVAACLSLQVLPAIRYTRGSELTKTVADRLINRITEELSLFESLGRPKKGEASPVVLLLDRRNDPVTPLLNQWTYQAMLHELLTIKNNRIDMSKVPGISPDLAEVVMSTTEDQFFGDHALAHFPELIESIQKYMQEYQKQYDQQTKYTAKTASIEDMQRFMDKYPDFKRISGNVSKHFAVVSELQRIVEANGLFTSSQLEQDLACTENRQAHFDEVMQELKSSNITNMQRLRLVLLYALRYEDRQSIGQLKDVLRGRGFHDDQIGLIDQLLNYAGAHARSADLYTNKSVAGQLKSALQGLLKGDVRDMFQNRSVISVLTQHRTPLAGIAEALMTSRGGLDEAAYPFWENAGFTSNSREPPPRAIIFVIGGVTFEEAKDITMLNKSLGGGRCVVLGGTTVHNCRTFLADVAQLGADDD